MNNPQCWRQPVPTDIRSNQSIDLLSRLLFFEILTSCQNKDVLIHFIHAGRNFSVGLKRGQCIFKVAKISANLKIDRKRVSAIVKNLSKWYSPMDIKGMPFGLILTLLEYDELVKMDNKKDSKRTMREQSKDNEGTANKTVKTVKIVKIDERVATPPLAQFEEIKLHFIKLGSTGNEAIQFFNNYEANGWMMGRSKMVNWKAAIDKWIGSNMEKAAEKKVEKKKKGEYDIFDGFIEGGGVRN